MTAPERRPTPALPERIERIYLIGICGTGMGSLAGMLVERGYTVWGSDRNAYPPMSDELAKRGIEILKGWDGNNFNRLPHQPDLVIVGNVSRRDNPEACEALARGIACISFPEALRLLFLLDKSRRLVITGTHGKTTTSAMVAWILAASGHRPSFMIGGVTGNFDGNFVLDAGEAFVVEGDEYDSAYFDKVPKFWHYEATDLIVNNIEFDHADIYPNLDEIVWVFTKLLADLPASARVWANLDDDNVRRAVGEREVEGVGLGEACTWRATAIALSPQRGASFDVWYKGERLGRMVSPMPGEHNVRNTLMAVAMTHAQGVSFAAAAEAMSRFEGVKKRQELIGVVNGVTIYDDFAHHPTAVRETVSAIRARHPEARLWGLFEAKSNSSRRAVFQQAYPEALAACDIVVLAKPWRKDTLPPDALINLDQVVCDLEARGVRASLIGEVDDIVDAVATSARAGDVVLGMSGSSFGGLHGKLRRALAGD